MQFKKQEFTEQFSMDVNTIIKNVYEFFIAEEKGAKISVERPLEHLVEATGLSLGSLRWSLYGVEKPKVQTQTEKVNDFIIYYMFILSFIY